MTAPWHLYLMAILYIIAGLNHFRVPKLYLKIIPESLPFKTFLNYSSGFLEVLFAVLLVFPETQKLGAWGIIALLIAVFPANMYMFTNNKASLGLPKAVRFVRLPLQLVLLYWAYQYC